jgi:hypothetical protein
MKNPERRVAHEIPRSLNSNERGLIPTVQIWVMALRFASIRGLALAVAGLLGHAENFKGADIECGGHV